MPDDPQTGASEEGNRQENTVQERAEAQSQDGLRDYWDDILGPRVETIEQRLIRDLGLAHPGRLTLANSSGKMIVSIDPDGKVAYGEGYTPDAASEEFWTHMALKRVGMEQRLQHLAIMEAMLVRLGRADLNYERVQLAAGAEGAGDHERAIAERAHMGLQAQVHQVLELARGLALRPLITADPPPAAPAPVETRIAGWGAEEALANQRATGRPGDPDCPECRGEGRVIGDCGDSPNVWFDPCPRCRPDPNCPTCRGNGRVAGLVTPSETDLWSGPCPTCRSQTPVDRPTARP
jgi:hypothetical protein